MITGDHPRTAQAVARQIGLVRSDRLLVSTGEQLGYLSDTQLQLHLDTPGDRLRPHRTGTEDPIVQVLKRRGEIVAVTGDGVNDAPSDEA